MKFRLFAVLVSGLMFCAGSLSAGELPSSLSGMERSLDRALSERDQYLRPNLSRIDSLKRILVTTRHSQPRFDLFAQIVDGYQYINSDSLVYYCDMAVNMALERSDSVMAQRFSLTRDSWYPDMGVVKEAIDDLELQLARGLYPENRVGGYAAAARLYFSVSTFYPSATLREQYLLKGRMYCDSLAHCLPEASPLRRLSEAIVCRVDGNPTMAKAYLLDAYDSPEADDFIRARAAAYLGNMLVEDDPDSDDGAYYLAAAALLNTRSGDLTGWALEQLGEVLYLRGDISRAYGYLNVSLENSVRSGMRVNAMRIADTLPQVSVEFNRRNDRRVYWLIGVSVALFLTLIIIVASFMKMRRDMRKQKQLRRELHQSNAMKEAAISNFIGLCLIYMERLEDFARMARRKISAGQVDSLYEQLKSGKIIDGRNRVVNEVFDAAFLRMYPDFVAEVNSLLQPQHRLVPPSDSELNTELRILAFQRLGVDDTQKIAAILGLSTNTVYTYRNKLRVRSLNRDSFDESVMKIGRI